MSGRRSGSLVSSRTTASPANVVYYSAAGSCVLAPGEELRRVSKWDFHCRRRCDFNQTCDTIAMQHLRWSGGTPYCITSPRCDNQAHAGMNSSRWSLFRREFLNRKYETLASGCLLPNTSMTAAFPAATLSICRSHCNRILGCEGFAFNRRKMCQLKRGCTDAVRGPCAQTGSRGWCVSLERSLTLSPTESPSNASQASPHEGSLRSGLFVKGPADAVYYSPAGSCVLAPGEAGRRETRWDYQCRRKCDFERACSTVAILGNGLQRPHCITQPRCDPEQHEGERWLLYRRDALNHAYVTLASGCNSRQNLLLDAFSSSQESCQVYCNRALGCEAFAYNQKAHSCILKQQCTDAIRGPCPGARGKGWCVHTRGWAYNSSEHLTLSLRSQFIERGQATLSSVSPHAATLSLGATACGVPRLQQGGGGSEPLLDTVGSAARYYSAFHCGNNISSREICLTAKQAAGRGVLGLRPYRTANTKSMAWHKASSLLMAMNLTEDQFAHNMAILRLRNSTELVMVGGLQGFTSDRDCRAESRRASIKALLTRLGQSPRQYCLTMDQEGEQAGISGIRMTRGHGWPWSPTAWSPPRVVITGSDPPGCIDRRPDQTGWPRLTACEFDGRLSLVQHRGSFHLYARANLRYRQVVGGRYVQKTASKNLEPGSWMKWEPIRILGVLPAAVDIYFFAAQTNPVDQESLLATFPMNAPPQACIALSFSQDGVTWSRPISLLRAASAFRTARRSGSAESGEELEFRSSDHPAAGVLHDPFDQSLIHIYVQHAVRGVSMRQKLGAGSGWKARKAMASMRGEEAASIPHVRRYSLTVATLIEWTRAGLEELDKRSSDPTLSRTVPL